MHDHRQGHLMNTHLIRPIQPYFMLYAQSSYQKKQVHRDGISHFYCFTVDQAAMAVDVVPDGSIDIIIKLHDDKTEAWVCGSSRILGRTFIEKGCSYFGVRYQIGMVPDFLSIKPKDIVDQTVPLQSISPLTAQLLARLSECHTFEQQITAFQQVCVHRQRLVESSDLSQTLIKLMLQHRGNISVAELSQQSGYSARTISSSFNNYYGLSPKAFNLILRYQQVLDQLMQSNGNRLTDLATDMGYSDQSHFCRQFKRYNGQGPREFQNILKEYRYKA